MEKLNFNKEELYLIGFFYADGCLHSKTKKHKHSLSVTLSVRDSIIIDNYKKYFFGCTYLTKQGLSTYSYNRWYLSSKNLYENFEFLGLTPKKTFSLNMPILNEYKDFIRGYFDGDGSVFFTSVNSLKVNFQGPEEFLLEILKILMLEIDPAMNVKVRKGHGNISTFCLNQTQSILLYKWMYYDNCLCLERKRIKFEDTLKKISMLKKPLHMWTNHDDNIIMKYYKILSTKDINERLTIKRTETSIKQRYRKINK